MGKPLDIAAAELSLKDKVSKPLKKVDKGMKKSVKLLDKTEKQTKKNTKQNLKQAKSLEKIAKAEKKIKGAGGAGGFAGGRGGGGRGGGGKRFARTRAGGKKAKGFVTGALSTFSGGVSALPVVGGAIAAILGAIAATRKNFIAGLALQKDIKTEGSNFLASFKSDKDRARIASTKSTFFRARESQQALAGLRDRGVGAGQVAGNQRILAKFTKAQGLSTLTDGIAALTSGSIKAGRGLSTIDIKQIQALAPLLNDVATSAMGFERILDILKGGKMGDAVTTFETEMGSVVKTQNNIDRMLENTTRRGFSKTGLKAFVVAEKAIRQANKATAKIAKVSGGTVGSLITGAGDFIEDPAKFAKKKAGAAWKSVKDWFDFKADGGPLRGGPTIVGERGPELLVPGSSGSIVPNHRLGQSSPKASGGQMASKPANVTLSPTININISGNASQGDAQTIAAAVQEQLDKMVNSLRFELGMRLQG